MKVCVYTWKHYSLLCALEIVRSYEFFNCFWSTGNSLTFQRFCTKHFHTPLETRKESGAPGALESLCDDGGDGGVVWRRRPIGALALPMYFYNTFYALNNINKRSARVFSNGGTTKVGKFAARDGALAKISGTERKWKI